MLILTEDINGLGLPCLSILNDYTGALYHQDYNLPHPAILINKSWRKFTESVTKFLDTYDAAFSTVKNAHHEVSLAYEDILYNAAELIEAVTTKLPKCILPPKTKKGEWRPDIPKRWTKHIEGICNQLKHEHNFLVSIDVQSMFGIVRGFSLCRYTNNIIKPNPNFHNPEQAFAYGTDLRRIMVHIYLIANAVSNETSRLLEIPPQISKTVNDMKLLQRIANFMPLPFHYQKAKNTPIFSLNNSVLTLAESGGYLIPLGKEIQVITRHSADGHTKQFHLFT